MLRLRLRLTPMPMPMLVLILVLMLMLTRMLMLMLIPDAPAGQVAIDLGLHGGAHAPVSACASGAEAMMLAQMLLKDGRADLVLAGGTEAPVNRLGLVGFSAMRALSCRNDEPEQASRPYSLHRDGFVLSEGAGVLAMMRDRDAPAGAALGWQLASGSSSDGHHIVAPEPQGLQASRAIDDALRRAPVSGILPKPEPCAVVLEPLRTHFLYSHRR